ncbi:MAG: hypothetical protein D6820_01840 [Lentisphaerae bacterium]|nr:MAG: hypothetical protein D6820_01840 [Lentisphaerota bacterium]
MSQFKTCPACGKIWLLRENFLKDAELSLVGYNVNFKQLELGLFLFNHTCGTTLAIPAGQFFDMYRGTIPAERMTDTPYCERHCKFQEDLSRCPVPCECAFVREIIQIIRNYPRGQRDLAPQG